MKDLVLILEGLQVFVNSSLLLQGLLIEILFFFNTAESKGFRVGLELMDSGTDQLISSLQFIIKFL